MLGFMTRDIPELSFFTVGGKDDRFTDPCWKRTSSARRHSTIDTVIHAGQELPAIRYEQRDDLSDVLGGADATQRNIPEPIIRGKSRSCLVKLGGTRRRDNAGRHDVNKEAARTEHTRE